MIRRDAAAPELHRHRRRSCRGRSSTKQENWRREPAHSASTTRAAADASAYGPGGQRPGTRDDERGDLVRRQ